MTLSTTTIITAVNIIIHYKSVALKGLCSVFWRESRHGRCDLNVCIAIFLTIIRAPICAVKKRSYSIAAFSFQALCALMM